jgi:HlyD family secretion protein
MVTSTSSKRSQDGKGDASLAPEAYDFAPDLLTIQQSPPSRLPRFVAVGVTASMLLFMAWAAFAKLDIIAVAPGKLVPLSYTKVVQPSEPGVVTEVLVKDGDVVKAGQLLVRLDARLSDSDMHGLGNEVALKRLSLRRIEAELADRPFLLQANDPPALAAQVAAQYRARRLSYSDAVAQETETMNKARSDLQAAEQVLRKLTNTLPLLEQAAQAYEKLVKDGFMGEVAANEKKREWLEREQDMLAQRANVESLKSVIAQSERKIASLRSGYRSQLENERIDTLALLNRSQQDLDKSTIRSGMLEIRAPTDGIVKDLAVTTQGAVVQAGALLANIVPRNEPVQAEVLLGNEDVGFVAVGQATRVKIAAFPFQKYGLLEGNVIHVAADATGTQNSGASSQNQAANAAAATGYRALVSLNQQTLRAPNGETLTLAPGMQVLAEIHQGERTVLEYLLSPVMKVSQEAARER